MASKKMPTSNVRASRQAVSEARAPPDEPGSAWCSVSGRNRCTATGTPTPTSAATTVRWAATGTSSAIMTVPISAPPTVPQLQPAWKQGHDRPAEVLLGRRALHVHRDIPGAVGEPEHEEPDDQRDRAGQVPQGGNRPVVGRSGPDAPTG